MKNTLAVIAGLIAAILIISFFEFISTLLYVSPSDLNISDVDEMKELVSSLPISFFLIVLAGHGIGSFVAGIIIGVISKLPSKNLSLIAGGILMIAAIINLFTIPHPVWFMIINLLLYIPLVISGNTLVTRKPVEI